MIREARRSVRETCSLIVRLGLRSFFKRQYMEGAIDEKAHEEGDKYPRFADYVVGDQRPSVVGPVNDRLRGEVIRFESQHNDSLHGFVPVVSELWHHDLPADRGRYVMSSHPAKVFPNSNGRLPAGDPLEMRGVASSEDRGRSQLFILWESRERTLALGT